MRAVALLVLLATPAVADDTPKDPSDAAPRDAAPDLWGELAIGDWVKEARRGAPAVSVGIDGSLAAGIVIDPPPHPDDRAYPQGMVVTPPDPNDPIALELGTNRLRDRDKREAFWPRDLSLRLGRGADLVWDWVLPEL